MTRELTLFETQAATALCRERAWREPTGTHGLSLTGDADNSCPCPACRAAIVALVDAPASPPRVPPTPAVVEAAIECVVATGAAMVVEVFADDARFEALKAEYVAARAALLALYVPPSVRAEDIEVARSALDERRLYLSAESWPRHDESAARILAALTPRPDPTPETRDSSKQDNPSLQD